MRAVLMLLAACAAVPAAAGAQAPPADPARPDRGAFEVNLRLRHERVSQDAFALGARALTLRTALGYRTPARRGFSAYVEFENVRDAGLEDRHANGGAGALSNGVANRPVIGDPALTEVNQAYVRWTGACKTTLDAGRMEIAASDERFVGPVGFRQNHQSFDAARLSLEAIPRTKVLAAYIRNVNRVNGANHGMGGYWIDAAIDLGSGGRIDPFALRLDYDASSPGLSTNTWGLRYEVKLPAPGPWSLPLRADLALQRDTADNPADVDTSYRRLELGAERDGLSFGLGVEVLGSDGGAGAFQTPLATLHRFQGWADLFLTTPPSGIVDLYASAQGRHGAWSWSAAYHDFGADFGPADHGTEINAEVSWRAAWQQVFALTWAGYHADSFSSDTDKLWITTSYRFGAKI